MRTVLLVAVALCVVAAASAAPLPHKYNVHTEATDMRGIVADILLQAEESVREDPAPAAPAADATAGGAEPGTGGVAAPNFFQADLKSLSPDAVVRTLQAELQTMSSALFNKVREVSTNVKVFSKKSHALYQTVQEMKTELKNVKGNLGGLEGEREKMQNTLTGAVGDMAGKLKKADETGAKMQGELKQDESIKGALSRLAGNMKALYGKVDHLKRSIKRVRREAKRIKQESERMCGAEGGGPPKPKMSCSCRPVPAAPAGMELNEEAPGNMANYFNKATSDKFEGHDSVADLAAETDPVSLLQLGDGPDKKVCYCDDGVDALMELELEFHEF